MRIISILAFSLMASSCNLKQLQSQFSKKLNTSQFSVKCEARTEDQYYAKPDFAKMGFPEDAPYTEKYCSLFYEKKAWDGPFDSINWSLPITLSTVSSPNPDGTPEPTRPALTVYNLNANGIRKGSVLMGILGQWGADDVVMSFEQVVKIDAGDTVYSVKYLLSPIDDDYVSEEAAPNEVESLSCDESLQVLCLSDDKGNYWSSSAPRPPRGSCSEIIPKNSVDLKNCDNLPATQQCPAPTVYCAKLDVAKTGWQTKVQNLDCSETAEYPESEYLCG